jgi:hypothetical protein
MKILKYLFILTFISLSYFWNSFANINLTVSPISYEIDTTTWSVITKNAILFNRSDKTYTIVTWKSDFESKDNQWNPRFVRKSELVYSWQELSSWINIDVPSFTIAPWERKDISFTITVPEDATPGWHYWAIFFKNANSETSAWSQININVDYWVLLLVKVDWEIITRWEVEETQINIKSNWDGWWWWLSKLEKDDCPIIDLTNSQYDWKCIDNFFDIFGDKNIKDNINKLDLDDPSKLNVDDFNIEFETLFINEWNTHLKPNWTIKLVDKNWNELKWIWKETIKNEDWTITWEKIVDYLPINDNWWNVLPWTNRNFTSEWKWFPYEGYDENWKKIIKYWTPEEYYTQKNIEENWFLMPRERVCEKINHEKITAYINIWYLNKDSENVEFSSAKDLYIDYKEKYVWLNPYFFLWSWLLLFFIFFFWLIFKKKKCRCIKCKKKIDKDMKICPYCWTKQDKCTKIDEKRSK